ncbi:hypothetical protein OPV22_005323 [Ensete ventricosum]|uniref:BHLH domain-containing protein n=1 Tax=Ensete ventricosum TaxID=4639 RepID=A0AAV8RIU7_ENSVE|nr:hypothetical protein OPV22_005323 [Ensete ventricosum]
MNQRAVNRRIVDNIRTVSEKEIGMRMNSMKCNCKVDHENSNPFDTVLVQSTRRSQCYKTAVGGSDIDGGDDASEALPPKKAVLSARKDRRNRESSPLHHLMSEL